VDTAAGPQRKVGNTEHLEKYKWIAGLEYSWRRKRWHHKTELEGDKWSVACVTSEVTR